MKKICPKCKKEPEKNIWYSDGEQFICEDCWVKLLEKKE